MVEKIQINNNFFVRFITKETSHWFVTSDICQIIGGDTSSLRKTINSNFLIKEKLPDITGKRIVPTLLINCDGIRQIYQKSRSLNLPILLKGLFHFVDEPNKIVYACKEVSWLRIIKESFIQFESELQYQIGNYKIDLYFLKLQIAIECDENNHGDRSALEEKIRQQYIELHLQCQFVRFNPDEPNFNIGTVINKLLRLILARNKITLKDMQPISDSKRILRTIETITEKPCYTCKVVKPLPDFHQARENRDGYENICKICRDKRQEKIKEEKRKDLPENYTEKTCSTCKETKLLTDFFRDKQKWDGYALKCKLCWKNRNKILIEKPKVEIKEKKCTSCSLMKHIEEFYKRKCSVDGHSIYCKLCAKIQAKILYDKNHEKILEQKRKYRKQKSIAA